MLAMLRARQMWGGEQNVPGLREALGLSEDGDESRTRVDDIEQQAHALVQGMHDADWKPDAADTLTDDATVVKILRFAATEVVPRLRETDNEIAQVLHALDGGFIAAGPSGSPLRGLINVLPTGRNFYSVDPKAVPSRLAWETGQAMAESLLDRYKSDHGEWPRSVGLSVWGTSAMRTSGDDIAEVFALLGVRPVWDEASRRVVNLEVIDLEELGRPRIDVTVRISGFFRDAFPHVLALLDDAVRLVAALDEPAESNFVRAHAQADLAEHGDERRATTRIFGSKPGTYGAGLLQLIDSKSWRGDADLADVYTTWGGFAYGRGLDGAPAADDMRTAYRRITVAAKNTDTREHDIADADDYFQYHGGMVATVRAHRKVARGIHRRQHPARVGAHPNPVGGDVPGVPRPRREPAVARGDATPRIQGCVRDGGHRRLPVRIRRHHQRRRRLDVREARGVVRAGRTEPQVHGTVQPLGPARHRRTPARGGRAEHVGAPRAADPRRPAAGVPRDRRRTRRRLSNRPAPRFGLAWGR